MSIVKCFKDDCKSKPSGMCDCKDIPTPFCQLHAIDHFELQTDKRHQSLKLFFVPLPQTRDLVIQKINDLKRDIISYRSDIIKESGSIIRALKISLDKTIEYLEQIDKRCNDIVMLALQDEILDLPIENNIERILKLNPDEVELRISNGKMPKNAFNKIDTIESINKLFQGAKIDPFKTGYNSSIVESNQIMFFRDNTKELVTFNLETMQAASANVNVSENVRYVISMCLLPDHSLFCYGNAPSSGSGLTFVIGKDKNIKQLAAGKPNGQFRSAYANNYVYALGGVNNLAERYNLKQNIGESCSPLPQNNYSYSWSTLYSDSILLTGHYLNKVISYSIKQDNYQDLPNLALEANTYKSIFSANDRVYVIEASKNVYESGISDLTKWQCIATNNPISGSYPISHMTKFKDSIYFMFYTSSLYGFNLKTKQIQLVKNI